MSVNPDKMGLFQETEEDFAKILDAYEMPMELFVRKTGATYENQRQARKGVYQETIMPEAIERAAAMTRKFFPDGGRKVIADFSHLAIFQEDLAVKSDAQNKAITNLSLLYQDKQITPEEYREELRKIGYGNGKPVPIDGNKEQVETQRAQAELRGSVGGVQGILQIQASVSAGITTPDSAIAILVSVYGFAESHDR
jgi:hypothetical protein